MRGLRPAFPTFLALVGVSWAGHICAQTGDPASWLKKIATASRQINYAGTFVYQHGRQMETSRIAHLADASGDYEKLETLDGPAREFIRNNDNVTCYLPDSKAVVVEKRTARQFPAFLPEQISGLTDNCARSEGRPAVRSQILRGKFERTAAARIHVQ